MSPRYGARQRPIADVLAQAGETGLTVHPHAHGACRVSGADVGTLAVAAAALRAAGMVVDHVHGEGLYVWAQ